MKRKKGYSMIVLVIAITVILILSATAISMLQISREKTNITNFIFDINAVEEEVQSFYTRTGTLPVKTFRRIDMNALNEAKDGILSQLSPYDNANYYEVDLGQLKNIALKDPQRGKIQGSWFYNTEDASYESEAGYIVNEGSLKVYVVDGTEYSALSGDSTHGMYYTLTSNLVSGLEEYVSQSEEMLVVGNPIKWAAQADLRLVLPRQNVEDVDSDWTNDWVFKWDTGPKTLEEMKNLSEESSSEYLFEYGDTLKVKSNGIYTIYAKNKVENKESVINVNVTKVDDIRPTYRWTSSNGDTLLQVADNETGIKNIYYKTFKKYLENREEAIRSNLEGDLEARDEIDYYLLDGNGKNLIYNLPAEWSSYKTQKETILKAIKKEESDFKEWEDNLNPSVVNPADVAKARQEHDDFIQDLNVQLEVLDKTYPYLKDLDGTTDESRLVLYVEDLAGNATVIGIDDSVSTKILAKSYHLPIEESDSPVPTT